MLGCYAAMFIFGCFSAGWLFNFPQAKWQVAIIFFLEELWFFIPFLVFYPIQRKLGFDKSLWLFPFISMIWEWMYLSLEFTMGTHLSAYSQSNNIWLIQFVDITGMWGISFWLLLFNVLIFKAYKAGNYQLKSSFFYKRIAIITLFMLGIPLLYSGFSYFKYKDSKTDAIQVAIVPTNYSARFLNNTNNSFRLVEETLHRTDAFFYNNPEKSKNIDLYIWPETGLPFTMQQSNLQKLLQEAVTDWKANLLTGVKGVSDSINIDDKRNYVSGVLFSNSSNQLEYHHKTQLTPGQEAIPYHSFLHKIIPNFPIEENDIRYFKKGESSTPLLLKTKKNKEFNIGISLCFEQWYPNHWAKLSKNGANFYAHLAAEGWYGQVGFMTFMNNVTRMRSIENRKFTARAANIGKSGSIDLLGNIIKNSSKKRLQIITTTLKPNQIVTFYAKNPNWFPIWGLIVFTVFILFQLYQNTFQKSLKVL